MSQNDKTVKITGRILAQDSVSTEVSQSAAYLGTLSKAFSNAQAKLNLQQASSALATAAASLTHLETVPAGPKHE
jgi:hypothetical protein